MGLGVASRIFSLFLLGSLCFLASCGDQDAEDTVNNQTSTESQRSSEPSNSTSIENGDSSQVATLASEDSMSLLFIGNSLTYANDLPGILRQMLEDADIQVDRIESVAYPNYGLQDHWVIGGSREKIAEGGWDYVVLQQGPSATEGRPSLLDYTQRFDEEIRAAGATTALYMVWPSQARDFDFDGVSDSYRTAAESVNGVFFPAGDAWRAAWELDSNLVLYGFDGFHPSRMGSYLAAIVMFHKLVDMNSEQALDSLKKSSGDYFISDESLEVLYRAASNANQ